MSSLVLHLTLLLSSAPPPAGLAPLPKPAAQVEEKASLGRRLFFEFQLSGDGSLACASCHDPTLGTSDGRPLSIAYPGALHFRNALPLYNVGAKRVLYVDGRVTDLKDLVRDHVTDAQFMNADGRLVIERLRQIPEYEGGFKRAFGAEPSFGRILDAVATFLRTLGTRNDPLDRYLAGDASALSPSAERGLRVFAGKAGCTKCHSGPLLSDERFHATGVPTNPEIFRDPLRHITFRRFFKTLGVDHFDGLRSDVGLYALTKRDADRGRFRTASLREVALRRAFMHDGSLRSLEQVVDFYIAGGRSAAPSPRELTPLSLTTQERADLLAFLRSLHGDPIAIERPAPVSAVVRTLGQN